MMQRLYLLADGKLDQRGRVSVYCPACGRTAHKPPNESGRHWHACYDCRHLGAEQREVGCNCPSKQRINVFACAALGECTLGFPLAGVACCATCPSHLPSPSAGDNGSDGAT